MRAQRLRVTFARGELLRYITHLDLMRSWERALKRAQLPLAYSEGFTRHPQIAVAAPLPVGATGEAELMDVFLQEPLNPTTFAERLAAQAPPGLTPRAVEDVPLAWPSLQSLVREWWWRAMLPSGVERASAQEATAAFLAREQLPWELRRDKEVKRYDLRAMVLQLTTEETEEGSALVMRLRAEAGGRPEQVAVALGYDPRDVRIHRLALVLDEPASPTQPVKA